jgi:hypothetical protein
VAIFSGLAGSLAAIARRGRMGSAVPGVAISVALVPPLAVAGYGIGAAWQWEIVRGSLLLYGANLAGIVLSAVSVFVLAGMHHADVIKRDLDWHARRSQGRSSSWISSVPGLRSVGMMQSPAARVILVVAFVAMVAIPLRSSLQEIAREARVRRAVEDATQPFIREGHSFVISRDITLGASETHVEMHLATTGWFGDSARSRFEREASEAAGESVTLVLQQLPSSAGDLAGLRSLLAGPAPVVPQPPPAEGLRRQISAALQELPLPDSVVVLDYRATIGDSATRMTLELTYLAPDTLAAQARQILTRRLQSALDGRPGLVTYHPITTTSTSATSQRFVDSVAGVVARHPRLAWQVLAGRNANAAASSLARRMRVALGADSARVFVVADSGRRGIATRVVPLRTGPPPP